MELGVYLASIPFAHAHRNVICTVRNSDLPNALYRGAIESAAHIIALHMHERVKPLVAGIIAIAPVPSIGSTAHREIKQQPIGPTDPAIGEASALVGAAAGSIGLAVVDHIAGRNWRRRRVLKVDLRSKAAHRRRGGRARRRRARRRRSCRTRAGWCGLAVSQVAQLKAIKVKVDTCAAAPIGSKETCEAYGRTGRIRIVVDAAHKTGGQGQAAHAGIGHAAERSSTDGVGTSYRVCEAVNQHDQLD